MTIEHAHMRLADLNPAPYNPRTISDEAMAGLQESIKRFGLVQPIVWNRRTGHVVGGHQRVKALTDLGETEADVVVVDLDETEEKALNLTLNNPAIEGEFIADAVPLVDGVLELLPDSDDLALESLRDLLSSTFGEEVKGDPIGDPDWDESLPARPGERVRIVLLVEQEQVDDVRAELRDMRDRFTGLSIV